MCYPSSTNTIILKLKTYFTHHFIINCQTNSEINYCYCFNIQHHKASFLFCIFLHVVRHANKSMQEHSLKHSKHSVAWHHFNIHLGDSRFTSPYIITPWFSTSGEVLRWILKTRFTNPDCCFLQLSLKANYVSVKASWNLKQMFSGLNFEFCCLN